MLKPKPILFSLMLLTLSFHALKAQRPDFTFEQLAGKYSAGHKYFASTITLGKDGTYQEDSGGCTDEFFISGKYSISSNKVIFQAEKSAHNRHGEERTVENDTHKSEKLIINWGKRLYLIDEEELKEFVDAVNLGIEPRRTLTSDMLFLGSFFLKSEEPDFWKPLQKTDGYPILSEQWNSYLIKKFVTATIIKIENQGNEKIATINKGKNAGLKIGMKLVNNNQEPSLFSIMTILSVSDNSAKVSVFDKVKVGDKISSKFIQKENNFIY
jgi:hypothetical protein